METRKTKGNKYIMKYEIRKEAQKGTRHVREGTRTTPNNNKPNR